MDKYVSADTIWVLIGAFLVFSMQPGFAMVETGFTRAKNAGNIVMKNVMDMCLGSIVFWVLGFGSRDCNYLFCCTIEMEDA